MTNSQQLIPSGVVTTPPRQKRILVIDDSAELLSLSKMLLEMHDFEVCTAASGTQALAVLSEIAQPDLILLDMRMDDMSGPEFLVALEQTRSDILENVPVVFLTAMKEVPASKAVGFIRKPFEMDEFLAAVHHFIDAGADRKKR
jgi:CheY-like chemotaxis protein